MIVRTYLVLCLTFFLAFPSEADPNDTISIKDKKHILDLSFVESYTNQWKVSIIDSSNQKNHIRYWTDYAHILKLDGIPYLHRVQDLYDTGYGHLETWLNIVKLDDLTPVRYSKKSSKGELLQLEFSKSKVTQSAYQDGDYISEEFKTADQLYDWNLYGILLIGLPQEKGQTYNIPFWNQQKKSQENLTATIKGQEKIDTLSGVTYHTQKVVTDQGLTFWLVKEKPYVIQLKLAIPNGSTMIWEMM